MPLLMTDFYAPQAMQANIANVQSDTALRNQQVQAGQSQLDQQQRMQQVMQSMAQGNKPASMQQQGADPTQQGGTQQQQPSASDMAMNASTAQMKVANALIEQGIPKGFDMASEATKGIYEANLMKQQEIKTQADKLTEFGNTAANVTDQASYDLMREKMANDYPDSIKNDKLGAVYTPEVAKKLDFYAQSANSHATNLANQAKAMEIASQEQKDQTEREYKLAQEDELKARTTVLREGLKTPKVKADPAWVAHDKAVAAIEKVNNNPMLSDEVKANNIAGIQQNYHETLRGLGRTTIGKSTNITPPTKAEAQTTPQEVKTKVSIDKINTPVQVKTEADYAALPTGAVYKDPNGVLKHKGMR